MNADVSPLQEIERRVQLRAKEISLDMASDGGRDRLRSLIGDEVAAWSDAYKRGLRAFDLAEPEVVAERAYRNIAGYGPLEPLLADDDVWEMMIVGRGHLHFRERAGQGTCRSAPQYPASRPVAHRLWCRCGADVVQTASPHRSTAGDQRLPGLRRRSRRQLQSRPRTSTRRSRL